MLTDIYQTTRQGYAMLELKINGVQATVLPWQKPWLVQNGILAVNLAPGASGVLPPVWIPADPSGETGPRVGWWSQADSLVESRELVKVYLENL